MKKEEVLRRITACGLVAVVRAASGEEAKRITDACIAGGVAGIEITFTVPGAHKVVEELAKTYGQGEVVLGVGSVLDPETARVAILSGAEYVVTPSLHAETIRLCNRYRVPVMPGVSTLKDVVSALELGADIIKVFPGELFGPKIIKAFHGPVPQAQLMPTGGVSVDNVGEWIRAGAVAVGAGGSLTGSAKDGDYAGITETAKKFLAAIREARQGLLPA